MSMTGGRSADRAKLEMRAKSRALRAELFHRATPETYVRAAAHFTGSVEIPAGGVVAGYLPIRDEFDPRPLLEALARRGAALSLPVIDGDTGRLIFREWRSGDPLRPAGNGTMGPESGKREVVPDVVITPLLAFDRKGGRLGYGGGYYDRTLRVLRAMGRCRQAIGLGFAGQRVPQAPMTRDDVRLDAIVTEDGVIWAQDAAIF